MNEVFGKNLCSKTSGVAYTLNVFIFFAINLLASLAVTAAGLTEQNDVYIYISYLISPIALLISVCISVSFGNFKLNDVVKVKCKLKYIFIGILLIFGLMFSLGWVNDLSVKFFKLFGYVEKEQQSYLPNVSGFNVVPAILIIAVLPAIFEETFFRGLMLNGLQNGAGSIRAILIVGFCFSLYHGSPEQTVYQFICGCAFALLAVKSGSLLPSVVIHFINNAFIILAAATGLTDSTGAFLISQTAQTVLTVISALALVCALVLLIIDKTELKKSQKGGVKSFFIYASVGIAVMALIWILSLFGVN